MVNNVADKEIGIPFDIRQKVIASTTSESWRNAPHVSYLYEADVTSFMEQFQELNHGKKKTEKITLNTVLMRIIIEGIKSAPQVNAHISFNNWLASGRVTQFSTIDINMPMLLLNGQMVTTRLPDFGNKTLEQMTCYINLLIKRLNNTDIDAALLDVSMNDTIKKLKQGDLFQVLGRILGKTCGKNRIKNVPSKNSKLNDKIPESERLSRQDLNQGTITISNLGSAVRGTKGIVGLIDLIPPQVFAIGIGALQEVPGVYQDENSISQIGISKIIPFCLVFDHRALDFGNVAPFILRMEEIFKQPEVILTW